MRGLRAKIGNQPPCRFGSRYRGSARAAAAVQHTDRKPRPVSGTSPSGLYRQLLESWNRRDPAGYAALFADDSHVIGFDGSQMHGRGEIEASLRQIFADHQTAAYVGKAKAESQLGGDVAIVRAICGMVPPGRSELNPAVNAIQALVAVRSAGGWKIAHFQNTPAQFHGRPDLADALTNELRQLL